MSTSKVPFRFGTLTARGSRQMFGDSEHAGAQLVYVVHHEDDTVARKVWLEDGTCIGGYLGVGEDRGISPKTGGELTVDAVKKIVNDLEQL